MKGMITQTLSVNQPGIHNPALINYNLRKFRNISARGNGEVLYNYFQDADIVWANYSGGNIICGNLTGIVNERGCIEYVYEQLTIDQQYSTGKCFTKPEFLPDGTIQLHEEWECETGEVGEGYSVLIEL